MERFATSNFTTERNIHVKLHTIALAGALVASTSLPAFAASTLDVPIAAAAPSNFANAAVAQLGWDASNDRSADEAATVHTYGDGTNLYVRFDASQREQMIGTDGGDYVAIDLWPAGATGDAYRLGVNLDGSHTSDSSANTANWSASASKNGSSYSVTMKIPMSVFASASTPVKVQFTRYIASSGVQQVWSHGNAGAAADDIAQAGTMMLNSSVGSATTQPGGKTR